MLAKGARQADAKAREAAGGDVINLRGLIVPVIDMRIRFNLDTPNYDQFTIVIVLNIGANVMGMVVDSVSDAG